MSNCKCKEGIEGIEVYIVNKSNNPLPEYKTTQSSGMDLHAFLRNAITIAPNTLALIPTGLSTVLPDGYEWQIRSRSGLAYKNQVSVLNSPGTIDADYRDDISVLLFNHGNKAFVVNNGDRVAQMVLCEVPKAKFIEIDNLNDVSSINRGGGLGSTGV